MQLTAQLQITANLATWGTTWLAPAARLATLHAKVDALVLEPTSAIGMVVQMVTTQKPRQRQV